MLNITLTVPHSWKLLVSIQNPRVSAHHLPRARIQTVNLALDGRQNMLKLLYLCLVLQDTEMMNSAGFFFSSLALIRV